MRNGEDKRHEQGEVKVNKASSFAREERRGGS